MIITSSSLWSHKHTQAALIRNPSQSSKLDLNCFWIPKVSLWVCFVVAKYLPVMLDSSFFKEDDVCLVFTRPELPIISTTYISLWGSLIWARTPQDDSAESTVTECWCLVCKKCLLNQLQCCHINPNLNTGIGCAILRARARLFSQDISLTIKSGLIV